MSIPPGLQFIFMHQMPYTALPSGQEDFSSVWVDFPNRFFEPSKARALYEDYWAQEELADRLGFDGILLTEHHSTVHSMNAATSLTAAALVNRVQRAKFYMAGTPINLEYPNRVAEEYALLDVFTRGRVVACFPLGTGMEYWANANQISPLTARARFRESVDVILKAWTEPGPFSYDGQFFNYRYLNPWPRPWQKPHPPIYVVGSGSQETLDYTAEMGFGYAVVALPLPAQKQVFAQYRRKMEEHGHDPTPDKLMFYVRMFIAETEAEAERQARPHLEGSFANFLRTTPRYQAPPGYVSVAEFRRRAMAPDLHGATSWEVAKQQQSIVFGPPSQVVERVEELMDELGANRMICGLHFADLPHEKVVANLTAFAEEVMPRLRKLSPPVAPADEPLTAGLSS